MDPRRGLDTPAPDHHRVRSNVPVLGVASGRSGSAATTPSAIRQGTPGRGEDEPQRTRFTACPKGTRRDVTIVEKSTTRLDRPPTMRSDQWHAEAWTQRNHPSTQGGHGRRTGRGSSRQELSGSAGTAPAEAGQEAHT